MDLSKNDPNLVKAYEGYAADYLAKYGRQPTITSAARTDEKQAELYARWQAGDKSVYMPAKPRGDGSIRHGYALDISQRDIDEELLKKHNLWRPFGAKDPVHVELAGNRNGKPVTQQGAPMATAAPAAPAAAPDTINTALQSIISLLTQGQTAALTEGKFAGQEAIEAARTAQAAANRQADYLTAAGLNTPTEPGFLASMMQNTQQQMMQLNALQQERSQFIQNSGGVTGAIDMVYGKGTSTFAYDNMINDVTTALKQSQEAMQQYLSNTSTVAVMGQKTIASVSMAEAVAKQKALEAKAQQNAIDYGIKGQQAIIGVAERQEARDIQQERVDNMGSGKATGATAAQALLDAGLDPTIVKLAGGNTNTKATVDAVLGNPSALRPGNLEPKVNSTSDALILHTQAAQGLKNPVLKEALDSAFGVGGYASGALGVATTTFMAAKLTDKKYANLPPAKEAEIIGNYVRQQAYQQLLSIDPRDETNMYRANWVAMATVPSASVFRGPIGKQVLKDVTTATSQEAKKAVNDKLVIERAAQLVKSKALTADQAAAEVTSMFTGAAKFNNTVKKYDAIGLLPQTGYLSTIGSSSIGPGVASLRNITNIAGLTNKPTSGLDVTNRAEGLNPANREIAPGVDLTDQAVVRRLLLGELIVDRVINLQAGGPGAVQLNRQLAGDYDPLTVNTPPEAP